jgi:tetratricopeptide (TPR) repeat protein
MPRRVRLALLLAAAAGCQAVSTRPPQPPTPPPTARAAAQPSALVQQAAFKPSATKPAEPPAAPDELTLAADCLERGDDSAAATHLERHVGQYPDQIVFRARLADLLARLDRLPEAQAHFEAAASSAQDGSPAARREMVHYHTRLMEIARARDDAYAEHLHRGIGLYLVGSRLADKDAGEAERLLCKAATALKEAQAMRPDDARPAWYLYRVWSQLDQPRPAERALRKAIALAPFSRLTAAESRELAAVDLPAIGSK